MPEASDPTEARDESYPEPDSCPPPMGPMVTVSISLRALVPDWDAAAVAVAMRMVDRLQVYEQYVTYWQARPQVSWQLCPAEDPNLVVTAVVQPWDVNDLQSCIHAYKLYCIQTRCAT